MTEPPAPAGPTSTPAPAPPAAPAATAPASGVPAQPSAAQPAVAPAVAPADPAKPAEAPKASDPPADPPAEPAKTADPAKPTEPDKPTDPPADQPLFKLPEDLSLPEEAMQKFTGAVKGKLAADGKVTLTAQELVDLYADQARDANTRWQAQITAQDKAWETESKQRFTEAQLASAEVGVGFLSSFEPSFREVAKAFRNHPSFVAAMRIVGERLSEDTFLPAGGHREPAPRRAADVLYGKRN